VAQETLTNVVRHAQATELRVVLERVDGALTLTVADNGQGFEESAVNAAAHFGLQGIRERVAMIGGRLSIDSRRGFGTTMRVTVPVEDRT
jgi:signal transduction histidine kinase